MDNTYSASWIFVSILPVFVNEPFIQNREALGPHSATALALAIAMLLLLAEISDRNGRNSQNAVVQSQAAWSLSPTLTFFVTASDVGRSFHQPCANSRLSASPSPAHASRTVLSPLALVWSCRLWFEAFDCQLLCVRRFRAFWIPVAHFKAACQLYKFLFSLTHYESWSQTSAA